MPSNLTYPSASSDSHLIRFFAIILGVFIPAPKMLAPVKKIPQAAPTTDNPTQSELPSCVHMNGLTCTSHRPTLNCSPWPVKSMLRKTTRIKMPTKE